MGIVSKSFQKLHGTGFVADRPAGGPGKLPSQYGGLNRMSQRLAPQGSARGASAVRKCTPGDLGVVSKSGTSEGARKGAETKRAGGGGAQPKAQTWEESVADQPKRVAYVQQFEAHTRKLVGDNPGGNFSSQGMFTNAHMHYGNGQLTPEQGAEKYVNEVVRGGPKRLGKSLGFFNFAQSVAKAKDRLGHGSEKRNHGGDQHGEHVAQDAENGPVHFVRDPKSGYVSAVWPNSVADQKGNITAFDPQGGHGAASKEWFKTQAPASPEEAQKVHNQLTGAYGYKLGPLGGSKSDIPPSALKNALMLRGYSESAANTITAQYHGGNKIGTEPKTAKDVAEIVANYKQPREKVIVRGVEMNVPTHMAGQFRRDESAANAEDLRRNDQLD